MGSSGAGKTTLLNCLAGQLPFSKGTEYRGRININGVRQADSRHPQAYIKQDDVFYCQLTVRSVSGSFDLFASLIFMEMS